MWATFMAGMISGGAFVGLLVLLHAMITAPQLLHVNPDGRGNLCGTISPYYITPHMQGIVARCGACICPDCVDVQHGPKDRKERPPTRAGRLSNLGPIGG